MLTKRASSWGSVAMVAIGTMVGQVADAGAGTGASGAPVAVIIELHEAPSARVGGPGRRAASSAAAGQRARVRAAMLQLERQHAPGGGARGAAAVVAHEYAVVLNGFAASLSPETIQVLKTSPDVRRIVPDGEVKAVLDVSVGRVRAPEAWAATGYEGAGTTIAVIDTGVDYTQPDLGGCLGPGCKVVGGYDFVNGDGDPIDDHGHGTHCAATAAGDGALRGVAPAASILAYKVLGETGSGTFSDVIAAIERATDPNGDGDPRDHVTVISMSLGGGGDEDDPVSSAVDSATAAGVLSVIAAGNSGGYFTIGSPGTARTALTVGATDDEDAIAYFSSRGPTTVAFLPKPELTAPGVEICAASIPGAFPGAGCRAGNYSSISGTSMATPHVAGAAALLRGLEPSLSPEEVKAALVQSSTPLPLDLVTGGAGRLDVRATVDVATIVTPAVITLGVDADDAPTWSRSTTLTVRNVGAGSRTYTVAVPSGSFPAGVVANVSPSSLTLAAGASGNVTLDVLVDNDRVPDSAVAPYVHSGAIVVTSGSEQRRVVASFAKFSAAGNDACEDATAITTSTYSDFTTTALATLAPDDPATDCACGRNGHTVWYRFTAAGDGTVAADTVGSDYDTVLAAFTGACGALAPVGTCNDDSDGLQSRIVFDVAAGETYYVQAASYCGTPGGALAFTMLQDVGGGTAPANDTCAAATVVASVPFADAVDTRGATTDPSDPPSTCGCGVNGTSVWYRVTPRANGVLTASTSGSSYDTVLAVFSGTCGSLVPVGECNDDADGLQSVVSFSAEAGVSYYVEVTSFCGSASGDLRFTLDADESTAQPIAGKTLIVNDKATTRSARKIQVASLDAAIAIGGGGDLDPTRYGAVLILENPSTGESDLHALPATGWRIVTKRGRLAGYRFRDASTACPTATLANGKLQVSCKGAAIGFSLDEPRQESLAVTFVAGDAEYCMVFGGEVTRDLPTVGNKKGVFSARNAPPPARCRY